MATGRSIAILIPSVDLVDPDPAFGVGAHGRMADYWALTKPEVNILILVATSTGFCLGVPGHIHHFPWLALVHTLLGTLLVAGGTAALNHYLERSFDGKMRRTARRPLAAGRLRPSVVLCFGIALSALGCTYLAVAANMLSSLLATLTLLSYLFLYTPLKRQSPFCVMVGAFPGAVPPLIGCAAASGGLNSEAWLLYAMLFLWQFPHFMAIAWMYRDDYDRAGYRVLPHGQMRFALVAFQTILPLLVLVPVSVLALSSARTGIAGSFLLSLGFFSYGWKFVTRRSRSAARRLLLASVIYLPCVCGLMLFSIH